MAIKINVDGLDTNRSNLLKLKTEAEDSADSLKVLIGEIESSWEGNASKKFVSNMREYYKKIEHLNKAIETNAEYIEEVVNIFVDTDKKANKSIDNSF